MKKIIIAAMLLIGMIPLMAQSFEFQYQSRSLDDGATVTITAEENVWGELACETNPSGNPTNGLMLKLLSGTSADVKAELQIEDNTWDNAFVQWCMGGACVPLTYGEASSLRGDLNNDGKIDTSDVVTLVNIIMGKE